MKTLSGPTPCKCPKCGGPAYREQTVAPERYYGQELIMDIIVCEECGEGFA